jgi:pyruvate dehydrogenase E1 component alpha subunit
VAYSFKLRRQKNVVVCFFGDGATNEGAFHEAMNAAAIWKLPVVYVCENNLYAATTSVKITTNKENPAADRACAYDIPAEVIDGNDVIAVNEAATRAIARARNGEGPTILELKTYRHSGHSRNDARGYRAKEEEAEWHARDPVKTFRVRLLQEQVMTEGDLASLEKDVEDEIEAAVAYAIEAPFPELQTALADVYWEGSTN